ncbi:MAG TPA: FAD-linked oxidase C-terminal domain-containing protein [Rhodothermales bacterium]|nr:FAD-linked oxidase C-terminal domain-containing protein [Rhodothermales bacterium]
MATPEKLESFLAELRNRVGGDVLTDRLSRFLYSTDASMYQMEPLGVLVPRSLDDVHTAVELASRWEIPILARGGGSSLAGQTVAEAVVIDFSKHVDAILEFDPERRRVTVEPGLVLDVLNDYLAPHGIMVGPDPASSNRATIGGMVANNATGTHSILYGSVVDHVVETEVILADGSSIALTDLDDAGWTERASRSTAEGRLYRAIQSILEEDRSAIESDTPRHWRRAGGYRLERLTGGRPRNLSALMCGSEGTLAVLKKITLSLVDRPKQTGLGIVHFNTRIEALEAVPEILTTNPSAIELLDRHGLDQCRAVAGYAPMLTFVEGNPDALLITEYYGESESEVAERVHALRTTLHAKRIGNGVVDALSRGQITNVWTVRKAGLGLILGVKGDFKPVAFMEDAAVPTEHLAEYIRGMESVFAETKTRATMYAHASAGCLHVRPFINTKDAREVEKMAEIAKASASLVSSFGGALASEHGDGLARSWLAESFYGKTLYESYRKTKRAFDPRGILNPGKVSDAPPMTENLRIGPEFRTVHLDERLDFTEDHGYAGSVELCTGVGSCRKLIGGTMCPSFMVTRDERHSTRGRANALRAALSGELGDKGFADPELYDAMSLCISCKACKSECPSAVDMAKLKLEYMGHYWSLRRPPFRDRFFANMGKTTRRIDKLPAALVNWAFNSSVGRRSMGAFLGLARERMLPALAAQSLLKWNETREAGNGAKEVVLFADTFNCYYEPEVGRAAVELLERLGYNVIIPHHGCCGRTYMSKGFVDDARRNARRVVDSLHEYASRGIAVVGLEPSCILSLRDEYHSLLPGDPQVKTLSDVACTLEEFIADEAARGAVGANWRHDVRKLVIHGHCHQKSLVGMGPAVAALSLPGHSVTVVDSGCCGMAGSFGYEREHYEWSIKMAERVLAPAVRDAPEETVIVASGTSCRAQIEHCTGRQALHPAQVLLNSLN